MKYIILIFIFTSCSLFKSYDVSKSLSNSAQKICLSAEGKGRLVINNKKYTFSYESALDKEAANWQLALDFPLQKTEMFTLDWSKDKRVEFKSSIDQKILKENDQVDPKDIEFFTKSIGSLIQDVIAIGDKSVKYEERFVWKKTKKQLYAKSKASKFSASFKNMVGDKYFGLMQLSYKASEEKNFRMDLVVKECFF